MEFSWKTAHGGMFTALSPRETTGLLKCAGRWQTSRGVPIGWLRGRGGFSLPS
jgi:hypothetical protein